MKRLFYSILISAFTFFVLPTQAQQNAFERHYNHAEIIKNDVTVSEGTNNATVYFNYLEENGNILIDFTDINSKIYFIAGESVETDKELGLQMMNGVTLTGEPMSVGLTDERFYMVTSDNKEVTMLILSNKRVY